MSVKTTFVTGALAAFALAGSLAATATPASAEIACNRFHECWHVANHVVYPAGVRVVYHPDTWRARHAKGWNWRADHDGRGYYRSGVWIAF